MENRFEGFAEFVEFLDQPDFYGVVVAKKHEYLKKPFADAVEYFRGIDSGLVVTSINRQIRFSSGALITFTPTNNNSLCGINISVAMVIMTPDLVSRDIDFVKTRLRAPCNSENRIWFKDS